MTALSPQLEHTYVRRDSTDNSKRMGHFVLMYSHDRRTTLASVLDINTVDCEDQQTDATGQAKQNARYEAQRSDIQRSCQGVS